MYTKWLKYYPVAIAIFLATGYSAFAQPEVKATLDTRQISIGDQARMFIEVRPAKGERLIWAVIPDTFNNLEVVEKGKIDTIKDNDLVTYKQRLLLTGWDSGMFTIPAFTFTSSPRSGNPYTVTTDSFSLVVQTIPVDTAQPFKPIADILPVKMSWKDYIWYILGALLAIGLIALIVIYFIRNRKVAAPVAAPVQRAETPAEKALRLLAELEQKQLWQNEKVKEYYVELTDILRNYIEERFQTPALELTTDELLPVVRRHKEMTRHYDDIVTILQTADMAKFAKAQPLPHEQVNAFDYTKKFVEATKQVPAENTTQQ